jgi:site-specific DNA-methyltransferase (adenine-specific)
MSTRIIVALKSFVRSIMDLDKNYDKIYCGDARSLDKIEDESVHLTVTSPPYYVGKEYEKYLPTLDDYKDMLCGVFQEVVRITVPGGKICINLGDIAVGSQYNGGIPEEILIMPTIAEHLKTYDTYLHARIIWEKDDPWANSSHVTFHDKIQHAEYRILPAWEYVFVFRKGKKQRRDKSPADGRFVAKYEWKELVHGVWKIRSVARNDFHEAIFPEQLVANCVKLYSFPHDVVFDPFMGSGTTAAVARKLGRYYLGYDKSPEYVKLAEDRLKGVTGEITKRYIDKTEARKDQETVEFPDE